MVNNAGMFPGGSILELEREAWDDVIGSHLTGSYLCTKYAAQVMVANGQGGKVINIGSMYSIFGPRHSANYAAAKAGILGLTRGTAVDLAPHNIQVNAILPGWYQTDFVAGWLTHAGRRGDPAQDAGGTLGQHHRPGWRSGLPGLGSIRLCDRGRPSGRRRIFDPGSDKRLSKGGRSRSMETQDRLIEVSTAQLPFTGACHTVAIPYALLTWEQSHCA